MGNSGCLDLDLELFGSSFFTCLKNLWIVKVYSFFTEVGATAEVAAGVASFKFFEEFMGVSRMFGFESSG